MSCIFCNVMSELFLYETTHSKVIFNFQQVESVYAIMIIPKKHVLTVLDLEEDEYIDLFLTAKYIHKKLSDAGIKELNYLLNEGSLIVGKNVDHVHIHIFTRKENDGIQNMVRPTRKKFNADRVEEIKKILLWCIITR